MTRDEVDALVRDHGFGEPAGALEPLPSLRLLPDAPAGASRLGGAPDVAEGFAWPSFETGPMSFVAQVSLAEVHAALPGTGLPEHGALLLFFDQEGTSWEEAGNGRVVLVHDGGARAEPPDGLFEESRFAERPVALAPEWTLPDPLSADVVALGLERGGVDAYGRLLDDLARRQGFEPEGEGPAHRLLGHPGLVQRDPALPGRPRLLLQIDSDGDMLWGDAGRLYAFVRGPEAADDARTILQST